MLDSREMSTTCPHCGNVNDMVASTPGNSGNRPRNGDVSFCLSCGEVSFFCSAVEGNLRKPDEEEMKKLNDNRKIQLLKKAWQHD